MNKSKAGKSIWIALLFAVSLIFISRQAADAGWTNVTPAFSTKTLYGIWGTSPSNIYAVGLDGTILHYDGTTWAAEISNATKKLNAVWGSSEEKIFVVGDDGALVFKDGLNSAWASSTLSDYKNPGENFAQTDLVSIRGTGATNVYLGSYNGYFINYDGTGWTEVEGPGNSAPIADIWPFSATNIYVTRFGGYGMINHWDGDKWTRPYQGLVTYYLNSIWASSTSDIYVCGEPGLILHSTTGNLNDWSVVPSPTSKTLKSICGSSATNIFAAGLEGTIIHNKGAGFVDESYDTVNDIMGIWVSTEGTVAYAVGSGGMILKYTPDTTTTTTTSGGSTTTTPGGVTTTTSTPGGNTTTTSTPGGTTTSIPGNVTTSIVPPGEVGADFIGSPLTGKMPLQVQFTNLSGGDIANYLWVFGDGGVSTEKNPSHVYENKGKFDVNLTVIGTDNSKTATKTREQYIDVKGKCFLASSLDSPGQLETLRAMRDLNLDNYSGMLMTAVYYRNAAEMNELLNEYPELRSELRSLISENMDIFEGLLKGDSVTVQASAMSDTVDYLYKVKARGSMALQNDIDFMLLGIQNGYFLNALGIALE